MDSASPYVVLFHALSLIPILHYVIFLLLAITVILYHFLEIHLLSDILHCFRGDAVTLTYNHSSPLYQLVITRCKVLHERFRPTPWLASPHLQTMFLSIFGTSPNIPYKRILFPCSDGGTIALDWLIGSDGIGTKDSNTPIMLVIPGLTSDSTSAYVKHFAFKIAQAGWNVVVSNHRGLGGVSITSDCFYNAGWTEDIRNVVQYIRRQYPEGHIFAVGTSIGANILVKYLGEDGTRTPLVGAAAICSPWDLVVCDRFISRRLAQRFYDRVLAIGLQGYAKLHQSILARLVDWNGIEMSQSIRDFDNYATRVLGKFETVDTYYRRSSCVDSITNVKVPLLCISSLDDPVCTREAIPWDECRANINVVLATTQHGGHLAYYEGLKAKSLWWVRAAAEFFHALHDSPLATMRAKFETEESSIPGGQFHDTPECETVATVINKSTSGDETKDDGGIEDRGVQRAGNDNHHETENSLNSLLQPFKRRADQLARYSRASLWLLAYLAITTTWPLLRSTLFAFLNKKLRKK